MSPRSKQRNVSIGPGTETAPGGSGAFRAGALGLLVVLGSVGPVAATPAPPAAESACLAAIARTESSGVLPHDLLGPISRVESGRPGIALAWPWTVNAQGQGYYLRSKAEAVELVRALQARNVRSIDVGCMQINLLHHPRAFASLDDAFDPDQNVRYASQFLYGLREETGDWGQAIARYHSGDPARGEAYRQRVQGAGASGSVTATRGSGTLVLTLAELRQGDVFRQALAVQRRSVEAHGGRAQRIVILGDRISGGPR